MAFNLDDYEPVADRITAFWKDHPEGSITTDLIDHNDKRFIVKATVYLSHGYDRMPTATGYAEEIIGSTNVNRTSALENCETSAIGRALANLGYAVKNRASREEMAKAQPTPRPRSGGRRGPTPRGDGEILSPPLVPITEVPQSHDVAPRTNGNADGVGKIRSELLAAVGGDLPKARMIWRTTLETFGLATTDDIPDDLIGPIETAVKAML